jgi:hypothetical protein
MQVAALTLPRPHVLRAEGMNSETTEVSLMNAYSHAVDLIRAPDEHFVIRWEAVGDYAAHLEKYSKALQTYAALGDLTFVTAPIQIERVRRELLVEQMLDDDETRPHGLAAALSFATTVTALAVAVTAFAVKEPTRNSYCDASTALRTAELRLAEFEVRVDRRSPHRGRRMHR